MRSKKGRVCKLEEQIPEENIQANNHYTLFTKETTEKFSNENAQLGKD